MTYALQIAIDIGAKYHKLIIPTNLTVIGGSSIERTNSPPAIMYINNFLIWIRYGIYHQQQISEFYLYWREGGCSRRHISLLGDSSPMQIPLCRSCFGGLLNFHWRRKMLKFRNFPIFYKIAISSRANAR